MATVQHLEVFVEEASAEVALGELLPRILGDVISFRIHPHNGKTDLLTNLPKRLRAYSRTWKEGNLVLVLVDRDADSCSELKERLERAASVAGLRTRATVRPGMEIQVVNRIAIEELEAWFLGDVEALRLNYPRIPASLGEKQGFRDPDAMKGGTWETLERILKRAGYYSSGLPKIRLAREIAGAMQPERNRSKSFQVFYQTLREIIAK